MPDPSAERQIEFLDRLMRLTSAEKVNWELGRDEFWFLVRLPRFVYTITSRDRDDLPPFEFRIYRRSDDDSPSGDLLDTWTWDFSGVNPQNEKLAELYSLVKRRVVGYEDLLDGMLQDLGEVETQP